MLKALSSTDRADDAATILVVYSSARPRHKARLESLRRSLGKGVQFACAAGPPISVRNAVPANLALQPLADLPSIK